MSLFDSPKESALSAGQWVGRSISNEGQTGKIVLDLDWDGLAVSGSAHLFDDARVAPPIFAPISGLSRLPFQGQVNVFPIGPNHLPISKDEADKIYPSIKFPQSAEISIDGAADALHLTWISDIGTSGHADIQRHNPSRASSYRPQRQVITWGEFKCVIAEIPQWKYIYRGQSTARRLTTGFHRTNRRDLVRFLNTDVPHPYARLSARTKHFYNVMDSRQNASFYGLIQHHGYPTPLLDWTYSPFVAAYFAFLSAGRVKDMTSPVRILCFAAERWVTAYSQVPLVAHAEPHFSLLEVLAIDNERVIPQQALASVTNVEDIEGYIAERERGHEPFLQVFDVTRADRDIAIRELSMMGITAGSLFPGLDGACAELRARFFLE